MDVKKGFLAFLTAILAALTLSCAGVDPEEERLQGLLSELDQAIADRPLYERQKESRLQEWRQNIKNSRTDQERYDNMGGLMDEIKPYNTDSALVYAKRREALATKMGNRYLIDNAKMNVADILMSTGMYHETLGIMAGIDRDSLPDYLLPFYNHIMRTVYGYMLDFSISDEERSRYAALEASYRDLFIQANDSSSLSFALVTADRLNARNDYRQSIAVLESFMRDNEYTIHEEAICACTLAYAYLGVGDTIKAKENFAISAIADMQSAVREHVSLSSLALILYKEGDVDRAYRYLQVSLDDAVKSNARQRLVEITKILPIVNDVYVRTLRHKQDVQRAGIIVISLLAVFLVAAVFLIRRQKKRADKAKEQLQEAYAKLQQLNDELSESNQDLVDANRRIAENSYLKEEYIARYMDQCSVYIERLDIYRKQYLKLLNARKLDELVGALKSTAAIDGELKSFYSNFDSTFLRLFPTFVADFNKLLDADGQLTPKREGSLNTELRIFALIRLGVSDSVKIAQFLRYSVSTIYNYRTKVRNHAAAGRDKIEEDLMKIGAIIDR